MKNIALLSILFISFACNNENHNSVQENQENSVTTELFTYQLNGDSTAIHLIYSDTGISGSFSILPFEKDSRTGTITGKFSGDTLFATYVSSQEGMSTTEEIAFLRRGDTLIFSNDLYFEENYTHSPDYKLGSFKDRSKIKFDGEALVLNPIQKH